MLAIHGGRKNKKSRSLKYRMRKGGAALGGFLAPADYTGVATLPGTVGVDANFTETPNMPPQSRQVGGGYGYSSGGDAGVYGGSYASVTRNCTSGNIDPSRGGNNFMSGGMRRRSRRRSSKRRGSKRRGSKSKRRSAKKGGSKKRRSSKRRGSKSKKGGRKSYKQRGCSKRMKGGLILM